VADGDLVASTTSKWGGACIECRNHIEIGAPVHKLASGGTTTKHGQGPGRWVCTTCAGPAIEQKRRADAHKRIKDSSKNNQTTLDIEAKSGTSDQSRAGGHWIDP